MSKAAIFCCILLVVEGSLNVFHNSQPTAVNEQPLDQADRYVSWTTQAPASKIVEAALKGVGLSQKDVNHVTNSMDGITEGLEKSTGPKVDERKAAEEEVAPVVDSYEDDGPCTDLILVIHGIGGSCVFPLTYRSTACNAI